MHLHFFIQTLTTLELDGNKIGDEGARYLGDALQNNGVNIILYSAL
jgi:hypothetical protein